MKRDTAVAALLEAALLGIAAMLGFLLHQPLIFASLGPTAYEIVETPERQSAHTYNILMGHAIGIVSALVALTLTHAWASSAVSMVGVPGPRVASIVVAGLLTVVGTLSVEATQPAALSTTVLIASGVMQSSHSILCICASVVLFSAIGYPLRLYRCRRGIRQAT